MTIDLWHYNFKLRHNDIDSQHKRDFTPAEIDEILNDAVMIWVEQQYSGNNHKQTGFEVTQQRTDNLGSLVVKFPIQPALLPTSNSTNQVFEFRLDALEFPYLHMVRMEGEIEDCSKRTYVKVVQHDDLNLYLDDPFKGPSSSPFPRLIGNFGKSGQQRGAEPDTISVYVYSDGTFNVSRLYPEYIKRPNEVSIGGYDDINGDPKLRVESDIPEMFHSQIIDIAVDEVRRILGDERFQLTAQKQMINE